MPPTRTRAAIALGLLVAMSTAFGQGFSFSQPDDSDRQEREARAARVADYLSTPCRQDLRDKKIMVVIGQEASGGRILAQQQNFGAHYDAINNRLRALGLKTYTPEEIRRQVAQAEIDAQFRNDPDAALSASKRLGASFVLRGLIASRANRNPLMSVNEVSATMNFTLTGSNGRVISTAEAHAASYAGADVGRMALTLVNEQADEVVAKLYADYCEKAGHKVPTRSGKPSTKAAPR